MMKCFPVSNSQAYYAEVLDQPPKSFIGSTPRPNFIKLFTAVMYKVQIKLECLTLTILSILSVGKTEAYLSEAPLWCFYSRVVS
jgi:hypothetical protein